MINLNNLILFEKSNVSYKEDLLEIFVAKPTFVREGIKIRAENLIGGLNEE